MIRPAVDAGGPTGFRAAVRERVVDLPAACGRKPLQAAEAVGVLGTITLGVAGVLRLVEAGGAVDNPILGDGQFPALLFVPLSGPGLVVVVAVESLAAGYRGLRADESLGDPVGGRPGYVLLRGVEAALAAVGVAVLAAAASALFAGATPAPVGVGLLLPLFVVGLALLADGFVRSVAERVVYAGRPG